MSAYEEAKDGLRRRPRQWLVTGVAGFIGCNLLQTLLGLGQRVVGLDNFATGHARNLDDVRRSVDPGAWRNFAFVEGDIRDPDACRRGCDGVEFVLHHAALGSVPRSLADPRSSHEVNVTGFLNVLEAARSARVARVVYASSSSVYGDAPGLPQVEDRTGRPLSPYAATKRANEAYAEAFGRSYGLESIGLRYFNVFGPRQDPEGPYAAVVPKWIHAFLRREPVIIFGDGGTSRDFCYVENVIQANLLAALAAQPQAVGQVYNVAVGETTTLNELFEIQRDLLAARFPQVRDCRPEYRDFREGDIRYSQADIAKARALLGYAPGYRVREGMSESMDWYVAALSGAARAGSPSVK